MTDFEITPWQRRFYNEDPRPDPGARAWAGVDMGREDADLTFTTETYVIPPALRESLDKLERAISDARARDQNRALRACLPWPLRWAPVWMVRTCPWLFRRHLAKWQVVIEPGTGLWWIERVP